MEKPKKVKLFIENMLIYGLGGIISKIIPLIMIPIVTRLMPDTAYFGLSDLSNTVISFAQAFAVMGMYDAMYRLFFDKEDMEYKKSVCSTALIFTLMTSLIIFVALLLAKDVIAAFFLGDKQYAYLVYICAIATLVGATNSIVSAPTRMQNKRKVFLITNTVGPILSYAISISLLLNGYYIIALPLAGVISSLTMEFSFGVMNRTWFNFQKFNPKLLKPLLVLAIPALPSFLIYWIFNSSDKLMITNLLSVGAAGIYAVGSKLGQASQLIYTAFAGGWQYFAFSTMKEDDQVKTNSRIFEYLGAISFLATVFICAWSYPIHKLLFVGEYVGGYVVSPYLFLAPLLQMLFQVAGTQLWTIKKTWPNMLFLLAGAIFNICFNFVLIPALGIEGAAIATLIGYIVSLMLSFTVLCRMKLMILSKRLVVMIIILIAYMVIWRLLFREAVLISTVMALIVTAIYGFLYRKGAAALLQGILQRKKA